MTSRYRRCHLCCFQKYRLHLRHRRQSLPLRCMLWQSHIVHSQAECEQFALVCQHLSRKSTKLHHCLPYHIVRKVLLSHLEEDTYHDPLGLTTTALLSQKSVRLAPSFPTPRQNPTRQKYSNNLIFPKKKSALNLNLITPWYYTRT
jgi:hypothetical protein